MSGTSRPPLMRPLASSSERRSYRRKHAWPSTPNGVSKIQQCKRALLVLRMSDDITADQTLDAIGSAVMEVLDVAERITVGTDECSALAEKLAMRTAELLRKTESAVVDRESAEVLKSFIDRIGKFFDEQSKLPSGSMVDTSLKFKPEFDRLDNGLDEVLGWFQESLDASQTCLLLRPIRPLTSQDPGSQSAQLPLDLPIVQLPPAPRFFFGRDALVNSIVAGLLSKDTCRIPILGRGGIGKTSVAAAVLNDPRIETKYGPRRIFVKCEGARSAQAIAKALAAALGVATHPNPTAALVDHLKSLHCAILLVLDNVGTAWDSGEQGAVEHLLAYLAAVEMLSLIITMRGIVCPSEVDWTLPLVSKLEPLDNAAAKSTVNAITFSTNSTRGDGKSHDLVRALEGLPLARTLMASQDQTRSHGELLQAYNENTNLLAAGNKDQHSSLEASIRLSLNCRTMLDHPQAQQLLSVISLLPDGVSKAALPTVIPSMSNSEGAADTLIRVGLATLVGPSLRVPAPTRDFMLQNFVAHGPCVTELQQYFMQMISRAEEMGTPSSPAATEALTPQFRNIQAVLLYTWKTWPSVSPEVRLGEATIDLAWFSYHSYYEDCTALLKYAIAALNWAVEAHAGAGTATTEFEHPGKKPVGDGGDMLQYLRVETGSDTAGYHRLQARLTLMLGYLYKAQTQYDVAVPQLTEAGALFHRIGDRFGIAQCLRRLGDISRRQYRYDRAVSQLTEAWVAFNEIGHRRGAAQCLQDLGRISRMQDRYDKAVLQLTKARAEFNNIGDKLGAAQCLRSLGDISRMQYRYDDAVSQVTEAWVAFNEIGDRRGAAQCFQSLGDISRMQDRYDEALPQLKEARAAFNDIGDRLGAAQCLGSLGDISYLQQRYGHAVAQLTEARAAFNEIGDLRGAAHCLCSLGDISLMQQRDEEALRQITEAQVAFQEIGNRLGTARCLQRLGDISYRKKRYRNRDAVPLFTEARAAFDEIGDRLGVAQCLRILGQINYTNSQDTLEDSWSRKRNLEDAVQQLTEARTIFQSIGYSIYAIARCSEFLGYAHTEQGNATAARESLRMASELYTKLGRMSHVEDCRRALETLSTAGTSLFSSMREVLSRHTPRP